MACPRVENLQIHNGAPLLGMLVVVLVSWLGARRNAFAAMPTRLTADGKALRIVSFFSNCPAMPDRFPVICCVSALRLLRDMRPASQERVSNGRLARACEPVTLPATLLQDERLVSTNDKGGDKPLCRERDSEKNVNS